MFVVILTFQDRSRAGALADAHKEWLASGFADGVFLLSGSVQGEHGGGAILAHGLSATELHQRVDADPFVAEGVVSATIIDVAPSKADERLSFLSGA